MGVAVQINNLFACALDELSVQYSDQPHALASLPSQRRPPCPLNRSPGELQKRFYTFCGRDEEGEREEEGHV